MMSREKRPRGRWDLDAASIILNLQKFHPAIFDCDAYRSRTRVQTVFYEFLQGRGGSVNDLRLKLSSVLEWHSRTVRYLSCRNLVDYGFLKPYYWLWLYESVQRGNLVRGHCKRWHKVARATRQTRCERWSNREKSVLGDYEKSSTSSRRG